MRPFARSRKDRRAGERSLSGGERPPSNLPNPVVLLVEDPCRPQPERDRHRPDGDGDAEDVEAGQHGQQGQDHQRQQRQPAVLRWVAAPGGWGAPRGQVWEGHLSAFERPPEPSQCWWLSGRNAGSEDARRARAARVPLKESSARRG